MAGGLASVVATPPVERVAVPDVSKGFTRPDVTPGRFCADV